MPEFLCPRCARPLAPAGELLTSDADATLPVLQCDHCVVRTEILGVPCEAALTFYVDDGRLVARGEPLEPDRN